MKQEVDVLLLDDDRDICVMVEAIIKYAGFKVFSFSSPTQLPEVLEAYSTKLLLMDMLLSGTDGRDICRNLKNNPSTSHIKVIMMSAHPDADKSCRDAGADDFIAKPFDMDYFLGRVKQQLAG
ncbi:MAG: response regulator [Chitinophagaceae bacterium]